MNESLINDKKRAALVISITLIIINLLIFDQVRDFDFVHYDDDAYVAGNRHVQAGLTLSSIRWAFTATDAGFWHPLTWLSLMLDHEMYGGNAGGYHGTNLIWHMLNSLLLFFVFSMMTGALWRSAFVAALFALHPLHVESVAWIAERKDVLSTFFWLLTMGAYLYYVKRPVVSRYLLILLFFSLGLMAKPMLVTLPCVLLLLDFWPLDRAQVLLKAAQADCQTITGGVRPRILTGLFPLIMEKIPLLILSTIAAFVVYYTETRAGALSSLEAFPLTMRTSHALVSYFVYLGKTFWPVNLAVFYPHPGQWPYLAVLTALSFLGAITFGFLRYSLRFPYAAVGWLWYLGAMAPVIGFIQLGTQGMADRYTYVPLIGIFVIIAWGAPDVLKRWRFQVAVISLAAVAILFVLGYLSWRQTGYWRNAETLFRHTAKVTSNNYLAHNNLGAALARQGKIEAAIMQYEEALKIIPLYADALFNIGQALSARGRLEEAEERYRESLQSKPSFVEAHNNLGIVLARQGKTEEAVQHFAAALRLRPDYEAAGKNLRFILQGQGKFKKPGK
ncbi:MAG TPA: tetratricopeptide repeat protein [Syntrophales bacterium]|nr:tetratricopeptide repeat protein [Syntrophales bacterium]